MFLGRYMLGQLVPLQVWTRDSAETPTAPIIAPHADVFAPGGTKIVSQKLPVMDSGAITGYFLYQLSLDARFTTLGTYTVSTNYILGSSSYVEEDTFFLQAGGHVEGAVEGMHLLRIPNADFVLLHTDSGRVVRLRNPRT